jgi:predicted  nucleic acid-binding Zn-ribbon protein
MKISKQELINIVKEEIESEIKSLNEDDGLAAYLFGDGPEAQRLQSRRDAWDRQHAKDKEAAKQASAGRMREQGKKDFRSRRPPNPSLMSDKSYMDGYLELKAGQMEADIRQLQQQKKQFTGFRGKSIAAVLPGTKTNKDARNLLDKITRLKREVAAIDDGSWMEKYGK